MTWPKGDGPHLLVDDGGDATLLIHEGVKREKLFAETGEIPDPSKEKNPEFREVLRIIAMELKKDAKKWHKVAAVLCFSPFSPLSLLMIVANTSRESRLSPIALC